MERVQRALRCVWLQLDFQEAPRGIVHGAPSQNIHTQFRHALAKVSFAPIFRQLALRIPCVPHLVVVHQASKILRDVLEDRGHSNMSPRILRRFGAPEGNRPAMGLAACVR